MKKGLDVLFRLRYWFSTPLGKGVSLARHLHQPGESRSTSKGFWRFSKNLAKSLPKTITHGSSTTSLLQVGTLSKVILCCSVVPFSWLLINLLLRVSHLLVPLLWLSALTPHHTNSVLSLHTVTLTRTGWDYFFLKIIHLLCFYNATINDWGYAKINIIDRIIN